MDISEITIDKEFQELLHPLPPAAYKGLEAKICRDRRCDPLDVWKERGILIDGHNRLKICKEHGIRYEIRERSFRNRADVREWILENQLDRRNMTPFQKIEVILTLKKGYADEAKKSQKAAGGAVHQKSDKAKNTLETLGKLAGVSHDTVHKVETILKKAEADPANKALQQQIEALRRGDTSISINSVYESVKGTKKAKKTTKAVKAKPKRQSKKPTPPPLPPPAISPMSEARLQAKTKAKKNVPNVLSPNLEEQVDTMLATLEDFEQNFPKEDDRAYFYVAMGEWLQLKKIDHAEKYV